MEKYNPQTYSSNHQLNKRRIYNMQSKLDEIKQSVITIMLEFQNKNNLIREKIIFIKNNNPKSGELEFVNKVEEKINEFNKILVTEGESDFNKTYLGVKESITRRLSFTKIKEKHSLDSFNDLEKLNKFSKDILDFSNEIDYNSIESMYVKKSQIVSDMSLFSDIVNTKDVSIKSNSSEEESSEDSFM